MALTATASSITRTAVITSLNMKGCHSIIRVPNKTNLKYFVAEKPGNAMQVLTPILVGLCEKRLQSERYIVFCRTYEDTVELLKMAVLYLSERNAFYVGDPALPKLFRRICDKYDACTAPDVQQAIVKSFTQPFGSVRLVFATVAFAMGLDAPNVHEVIHWGPPSDVEMSIPGNRLCRL